ncbi:MAG: hypothetical protein ACTSVW_07635 [Candidatus Njordarchaeales archaeon]
MQPETKANISRIVSILIHSSLTAYVLYLAYKKASIYAFVATVFICAIVLIYASPSFTKEFWMED